MLPLPGNHVMQTRSRNTTSSVRSSVVGSVFGSLSGLMQHHGFSPPLGRIFLVEGIFPLDFNMGSDPLPRLSILFQMRV